MANIDKIKEQGNQAAPLLTELHDNKLILSCSGIKGGGTLSNLGFENLRGRQNIIQLFEKYREGKIELKDIELRFVRETEIGQQVSLPIRMIISKSPEDSLEFSILDDSVPGLNSTIVFNFWFGNEGGDYKLHVKAYTLSNRAEKFAVEAQFID